MSNSRKLIPIWQFQSVKRFTTFKNFNAISDHGSVGVDVVVTPGKAGVQDISVEVESLKAQTNQLAFYSKECCLPFNTPNIISSWTDPSYGKYEEMKQKYEAFQRNVYVLPMKTHLTVKRLQKLTLEEAKNMLIQKDLDNGCIHVNRHVLCKLRSIQGLPSQVPEYHLLFTGNSLCAFNSSNPVLLHPVGEDMSDLAVTPLGLQPKSCPRFEAKPSQRVKLKGGCIYQIAYQHTIGRDYCLVRKEKVIQLLTLNNDNELNVQQAMPISKLKLKEELCCAALSPHVPGEYLVASTSGNLELYTFKHNVQLWGSSLTHSSKNKITDEYWACSFGSHPRSMVYLDRTHLAMIDTRGARVNNPKVIFKNSSRYMFDNQELYTFQQSITNPFQYFVTSTNHLLLVDERFPEHPVQMWRHQFTSYPTLLSQNRYPSDSEQNVLVQVGCSKVQEICNVQVQPAQPQPLSLSPPWYCSVPQDSTKILRSCGAVVPERFEIRASAPVLGMCSVPSADGVTIFQSTSYGDLFYQDYFFPNGEEGERTHHFGCGYTCPPHQPILEKINVWIGNPECDPEIPRDFPGFQWRDNTGSGLEDNVSASRKFYPASPNCRYCNSSILETGTAFCEACCLNSSRAESILQDPPALMVESRSFPSNIPWFEKKTCLKRKVFDPFTQKLLAVWYPPKEEDDDDAIHDTEEDEETILKSILIPEAAPNVISNSNETETKKVKSETKDVHSSALDDTNLDGFPIPDLKEHSLASPARTVANTTTTTADENIVALSQLQSQHSKGFDSDTDIIPPTQSFEFQTPILKRVSFVKRVKLRADGF